MTAPLNVLQMSTQSATAFKFTLPFSRYLTDRGHRVTIACTGEAFPDAKCYISEIEQANVPVHIVPMLREIDPAADLRSLWHAYQFIRNSNFDVVHTHNAKAGFVGRFAAWLAGVPVVVHTNHGLPFFVSNRFSLPANILHIVLERLAAQWTDRFFVVSRAELRKSEDFGIARADDIVMIGQGIDTELFQRAHLDPKHLQHLREQYQIPPDAPVIGTVARLVPHKGIDCFLNVAQQLHTKHPETRFLVVGDGHDRENLIAMARQLGIAERVIFVGHVKSPEDVRSLYGLMDIFFLPTRWESFGVVFVEAMAMAIPVVGPRIEPSTSVIKAEETGLLAPLDDIEGFARAIDLLLTHKTLRTDMGKAGRKRAVELFSEARVFQIMETEYHALIDNLLR